MTDAARISTADELLWSGEHSIAATWSALQEPLVCPPRAPPRIVSTLLVFADEGRSDLDGRAVDGRPYPRDVWKPNLGRPMSSCVFALAETMVAGKSSHRQLSKPEAARCPDPNPGATKS